MSAIEDAMVRARLELLQRMNQLVQERIKTEELRQELLRERIHNAKHGSLAMG